MKKNSELKKFHASKVILLIILTIAAIFVVYPFLSIAIISLKETSDFAINPSGFPSKWVLDNYVLIFKESDIIRGLLNSLIISISSVCFQIFFGSLSAYALSKMNFKREKLFSGAFLIPMIFPVYTVIIPLYMMFKQLNLLNNYIGLILIYTASGLPIVIFILTSFMRTIPYQISESGFMEGASHFRVYFQLIMPLVKPAIATSFVISTLSIWNDFFLPMLMITNDKLATLPLKVYLFTGEYSSNWPAISSLIVILVIPILLIYLLLQRQIVSGVVAGAVKG